MIAAVQLGYLARVVCSKYGTAMLGMTEAMQSKCALQAMTVPRVLTNRFRVKITARQEWTTQHISTGAVQSTDTHVKT